MKNEELAAATERRRNTMMGRRFILLFGVTFFILHSSFFISCTEAQEHIAKAVNPEDSVAMMQSFGVNTLISDSGVIKYRIVTERWEVNNAKNPTRWEFMKGIFFEQFDEQFHVEGYIQADTAWYFDHQRLWKLRGRVSIRNVKGLIYTGEELYWDGIKHEFYSTMYSRVVTPERTMEGTYFRSDEKMEHYMVTNSKGSFLANDIDSSDDNNNAAETAPGDSATDETYVRPAAVKRPKY